MGEILFLAHRVPFPPDRGDKIRSCHLLRALAALAPVHVGCIGDDGDTPEALAELASLAASHCVARRAGPLPLVAARALVQGRPISVAAFASEALRDWVRHVLATRPVTTIFVFSGQMAQFVPDGFTGRVVMDFVDVDSAKFEAYGATGRWPMRWVYQREGRLLRRFEDRTARRATTYLFVSAEEKALFEARLGRRTGIDLCTLGNGIDWHGYDPAVIAPAPETLGGAVQLTFTGQMDYPPNVVAAELFAHAVMPSIRAAHADAVFNVVGRAPIPAVRALDGVNGTRVTGEVPDVKPWLAGSTLVVAPLAIARGVQNKVLEAMAMARPLIVTPGAATGIGAQDGVHLRIAESPAEMAARALALIADPAGAAAMGEAARAYVVARFGWERVSRDLRALVEGAQDAA
ncbi:TIGR03087 family PEP-CTERM/XrtA system glycosyltransferase [Novosphingobium sp. FKTRR1]|uniref:TIGR03087 family PEP-CTERM/XrtA system glycosyltransferase n=1 Tax=Novosphingobium sp. FKTRR1 TaxID=2879118 RepID=UPI001CF0A790|nr:TIGR03087 family PEP-CTERM/XrtA system glycosyltransferase [Novosphingobium sp. FKTRR1]